MTVIERMIDIGIYLGLTVFNIFILLNPRYLTYFISLNPGNYIPPPFFPGVKTEPWREEGTCPQPDGMSVAELGCQPRQADCGFFAHSQRCPFPHPRQPGSTSRSLQNISSSSPLASFPQSLLHLGVSDLVKSGVVFKMHTR